MSSRTKITAPKIEKGIPLPAPAKGAGRPLDPNSVAGMMRAMQKGDSMLLTCSGQQVRDRARKNIGKGKYAVRKNGEGFRVWRIK